MLVCSSCHPQALGGIDRAAADFHALGESALKRGLRVGFEALAWGTHVNDHRDAWEIVRRTDHASVGLILDSFHTLAREIDPYTISRIPADKIFFVQLADAPQIDMDLLYWSRHFRNMPGEGDLAVKQFHARRCRNRLRRPYFVGDFQRPISRRTAKSIAADGYRSLVALMDDVQSAEPTSKLNLPKLPARSLLMVSHLLNFPLVVLRLQPLRPCCKPWGLRIQETTFPNN